MKTIALSLTLLVAVAACHQGPGPDVTPVPGRGAITVQIVPNPIVATTVSGDTYDFPFEVVVRETGGRPVRIHQVSAAVLMPGGISLGRESWSSDKIRSMGFETTVAPHGELRYRFAPRKSVPDDRLFGGISAELLVEGTDDTGAAANATTNVTVRRD